MNTKIPEVTPLEEPPAQITYYGSRPKEERNITQFVRASTLLPLVMAVLMTLVPLKSPEALQYETTLNAHPGSHRMVQPNAASAYEKMSKEAISKQLMEQGETFRALTVLLEDIKTTVYLDNDGGRTLGVGYGLTKQIANKGRAAVIQELVRAGVPVENAAILTDPASPDKDRVTITKEQALNLLSISQASYEKVAIRWLGKKTFAGLKDNQRATVTYLAYNLGARNLGKFEKLKHAIVKSHKRGLKDQFTMSFKNKKGERVTNNRAGKILSTAFLSPQPSEKGATFQVALLKR